MYGVDLEHMGTPRLLCVTRTLPYGGGLEAVGSQNGCIDRFAEILDRHILEIVGKGLIVVFRIRVH